MIRIMGLSFLIGAVIFLKTSALAAPAYTDAELDQNIASALAEGNYGPMVKNHEQKIKAWSENNLKDPFSAQYKNFTKPVREYIVENREPVLGYASCVDINSKNSYGGYTGFKKYWFMFVDGEIVRVKDLTAEPTMLPGGIVIPANLISSGHFAKCN